jgi:CubicO group peptidase (beta-lactamase class C family)
VDILKVFAGVLAAIVLAVLTAWLSYPLWDGMGPWRDLPEETAPQSQILADEAWAEEADAAQQAIAAHRAELGLPAISAAVSINGELVWAGAAGWADLETLRPATVDTQFRIGSTSKAVTATVLARLVDAGEMALNAPISTWREDWPNAQWGALTPRQLASHTAGLREYSNNNDRAGMWMTLCGCRNYDSVSDGLEIFDGSSLLYEPGAGFAYSSFDVNLLGAAIEAAQQDGYLDVLADQVLQPLEIASVGGDADGTPRPDLASFYEIREGEARTWRSFDLSQRWASGGLVATSSDLVRIGGAWLDPDFIDPATREAMWTPQRLSDGEVNVQSYAVGWRFNPGADWPGDPERSIAYAHHGGVSKGAMSWLVVYPAYGLSIAVNINSRAETFSAFARVEDEIAARFLDRIETDARID